MSYKDPYLIAWDIVIKVIQEAEGRYNLVLHGHVEKDGADYRISLVSLDLWEEVTQVVGFEFLADSDGVGVFAEFGIYPAIRKLAEKRDSRRVTPSNES